MQNNSFLARLVRGNLVLQILAGILLGAAMATFSPEYAQKVGLIGNLFVGALKAVAPVLVFIWWHLQSPTRRKPTHLHASNRCVVPIWHLFSSTDRSYLSFLFPTTLVLATGAEGATPPQGIAEVLNTLLFKLVDNPVSALMNANYIGILAWGVGLGLALHHSSSTTKAVFEDLSHGISQIVRFIIRLAPFGILA